MSLLEVSISLSFFLGLIFLAYVCILVRGFLKAKPERPGDPGALDWHFIIPCRDEQAVIGGTLDYLETTFPEAHLWVIDDASTDGTARIVAGHAERNANVHLLTRRLPDARLGKGAALNHGYREISDHVGDTGARAKTIVAVVDADGRPSPNMLQLCAGPDAFEDETVGAVQVEVRMVNRDVARPLPGKGPLANRFAAMLARMQDIEFRGPISAMQITRRKTGTVNMGGNGQLNRLTALDSIAGEKREPWGNALLEDFELGLRLMLAGWKTAYSRSSWVDQEALWTVQPLVVQRTRWAQGSMQCFRYLPRVWGSPCFSTAGFLEILYFMLRPWVQVIGSVVYVIPLAVFAFNAAAYRDFMQGFLLNGGLLLMFAYAIVGIGEFAIWGWFYRSRCEPGVSRRSALYYGLAVAVYSVLNYVIAWRAFGRFVTGRGSWKKTRRNSELAGAQQPAVAEAVAK
ncbi:MULTISPECIES: glycosyltransferase family 2 protein [Amycolatopsis]|uniref:Glycosyltransferase, catalytic subunit of cellulose synthase and poly-beta-1,6-N-acetylglucosamine synthase n=2 Tax=Amycolatopsis TaxID=1813 RepID=A0A1I3Q992_9PSEU|nr:glycosyltransferase family 2 protein [Amycolatopsis sacchari]SFJ29676.1 Glycosyltransferase, catalytic subunit of cellulose synthase and poly-beta-1,6-N-acetylglucosamine synthase [Amycolatopsis sacchari]